MGQKVNPIGLRLGINRTWDSRWFSRKEYGNQLLDDLKLRKFLGGRLTQAAISKVLIERAAKKTRITLHSARPGVVIGKKGADIDKSSSARRALISTSCAATSPRSRTARSASISSRSGSPRSRRS